ncbi:MAG: M20/M25/M40 family metallo-hydrolase [Spirochaetota bacterium]
MKKLKLILFIALIGLFGIVYIGCGSTTETITNVDNEEYEFKNIIASMPSFVAEAKSTITIDEQTEMLTYLASDELEGRSTGEKGNDMAAEYIADEFEEYGLHTLEDGTYYQPFSVYFQGESHSTQNVIGYLPGNDPELKNEVIIVGAHYDHVGMGYYGTRGGVGKIHNGADDNASGVVAVLELADAFSSIKGQLNRTFVFILFSGEEMGLHGSLYYADNPEFPLEDTVFMLNLDMVGWLKNKDYLYSYNTRNAEIKALMDELDENYPFSVKFEYLQRASSDHYAFEKSGIPVSFLHTGLHNMYHTPKDDVEFIDFEGLKYITDFSFELLWLIDSMEERP